MPTRSVSVDRGRGRRSRASARARCRRSDRGRRAWSSRGPRPARTLASTLALGRRPTSGTPNRNLRGVVTASRYRAEAGGAEAERVARRCVSSSSTSTHSTGSTCWTRAGRCGRRGCTVYASVGSVFTSSTLSSPRYCGIDEAGRVEARDRRAAARGRSAGARSPRNPTGSRSRGRWGRAPVRRRAASVTSRARGGRSRRRRGAADAGSGSSGSRRCTRICTCV